MTRKQIAEQIGIHPESLAKLLRQIGIPKGRKLTRAEIELITNVVASPLFLKVTRDTLAKWYGIHSDTLSSKLRHIGIHHQKKLTLKEIEAIYKAFGWPQYVPEKELELLLLFLSTK